MNDLYRDYSAKGVRFVFVNANQNEKPAEVEEHAGALISRLRCMWIPAMW